MYNRSCFGVPTVTAQIQRLVAASAHAPRSPNTTRRRAARANPSALNLEESCHNGSSAPGQHCQVNSNSIGPIQMTQPSCLRQPSIRWDRVAQPTQSRKTPRRAQPQLPSRIVSRTTGYSCDSHITSEKFITTASQGLADPRSSDLSAYTSSPKRPLKRAKNQYPKARTARDVTAVRKRKSKSVR